MTDVKETWSELSERLEALGLKLKLHREQTGADVPEALSHLGRSVQDTFEAAGNAVKDKAVREDVREIGRLIGGAVTTTVVKMGGKVSGDVRGAMKGGRASSDE